MSITLQWPIRLGGQTGPKNETVLLSDLQAWQDVFGLGMGTTAGPPVTPETALKASAVYACVRLIAGAIAMLPIKIYSNTDGGDKQEVRDHDLAGILQGSPSDLMTAPVFWEAIVTSILLTGNAYGLIERRRDGDVRGIYFVPSYAVSVKRINRRLEYYITLEDGKFEIFDQDDVLHFPGLGWKNNGGMSPISYCREAIGLTLASEEYSSRFFSNGGSIGGYLKYPNKVTPETANEIRDYWYRKPFDVFQSF